VALLVNTIATRAALVALILTFGPGAHFNPAVTLAVASQHGIASRHARSGIPQAFSEFVATFGLLAVIWGCARLRSSTVPFAVAAYITAAYWFTASTSSANPAVTLARSATDTFAGIRPSHVPASIVAQLVGAGAAADRICDACGSDVNGSSVIDAVASGTAGRGRTLCADRVSREPWSGTDLQSHANSLIRYASSAAYAPYSNVRRYVRPQQRTVSPGCTSAASVMISSQWGQLTR